MRLSPIARLSHFSRIGVVVDISTCQWLNYLHHVIKSGVPVWIRWSTIDRPLSQPPPYKGVWLYFPSKEQVTAALAEQKKQHQISIEEYPQTSEPVQSTSQQPAMRNRERIPGSRQFRGETWQEFFARQEARHMRIAERESSSERQARLNRTEKAQLFQEPGKRGAKVYHWLEDDDGFLIRTHVTWGQVNSHYTGP